MLSGKQVVDVCQHTPRLSHPEQGSRKLLAPCRPAQGRTCARGLQTQGRPRAQRTEAP